MSTSTPWPMVCNTCNAGHPGDCDCMPTEAAAAATEIGVDDFEPADAEVLALLGKSFLKASVFIMSSLLVWHSGFALVELARGLA